MDSTENLMPVLSSRCLLIADSWYQAIAQDSCVSLSPARVRQRLLELAEQTIALLLADTFESDQAEKIGASLAQLDDLRPEILGKTQEILSSELLENIPVSQIVALQPRLAALLGGMATGFMEQVCNTIQAKQKQIRAELAAAHSQAKGALRESEMKFFKLAEMIAIGIFICHDTKFLYTNPAFQTTTGYTEAELLEMNFWDVTHPDHHELIKKQGVVYQGGEEVPSSYELGFVTKNGEVRWIDVNLDVIEFEGKVAILGSTFDLTERKRAEEILRQNEIRLSALLDAVPDMIFRMDAKGNIIDFKPASSEEFYVPPEQFLTRKVSEVLPPEVAELIEEHIDRAFATGVMQVFEYQLPGPTGFQDYEARLVTSVDNEVLAIVRNVTKRKRAEALILRSERLAALGQLAASLAHEVNNPLQAIQSHLDLVLDYPLEAGEREEYLNIIRQEVDRLKDVTRNTLDFASSKSTSRQPVSVTNVIQQILALINNKLRLSDIELTTDFYHVAPVLAEPAQLAEVFLNLLMNMIEAIESVATNGRLNIVVYPEDGEVAVSFTNSGPTIPQEELEHIFEPFFTTKPEGSGLGLWISYNLIQQHGGELTVENAGDTQGVIFTMKLPSAPDENSS